jgi:hypothetical protein
VWGFFMVVVGIKAICVRDNTFRCKGIHRWKVKQRKRAWRRRQPKGEDN